MKKVRMGYCSVEKPKRKHRKGLWSPEEDQRLRDYILKHGHGCWSSVPTNAGLERNGKSCRLRWINYLRPGLKRGAFSMAEEDTILNLHSILGNKWSQIAHHLPGRSDNEIKNYWHSYLKKRAAAETAETGQIQRLGSSILLSESIDQTMKPSPDQDFSLPKVIFAEWLDLDLDLGNNFKNVDVNYNHSPNNGEETLVDGLLHNGEVEINSFVDELLPSTFKFSCHTPIDYFPQDFCAHSDAHI